MVRKKWKYWRAHEPCQFVSEEKATEAKRNLDIAVGSQCSTRFTVDRIKGVESQALWHNGLPINKMVISRSFNCLKAIRTTTAIAFFLSLARCLLSFPQISESTHRKPHPLFYGDTLTIIVLNPSRQHLGGPSNADKYSVLLEWLLSAPSLSMVYVHDFPLQPLNFASDDYHSHQYNIVDLMVSFLTAVTFWTLFALIFRSPACFALILASFIRLDVK